MAESIVETRDNPNTSYEASDWPIGKIGLVFLATFILLAATPFIVMWGFPRSLPDQSRILTIAPPPPRQQVAPAAELAAHLAREKALLNAYYWVDRDRGLVHIPIEEAMKRVATHGIPGFPPKAAP
jgi:hypothetical protein